MVEAIAVYWNTTPLFKIQETARKIAQSTLAIDSKYV